MGAYQLNEEFPFYFKGNFELEVRLQNLVVLLLVGVGLEFIYL